MRIPVTGMALARAFVGGEFLSLPFRLQGGVIVQPWTTFPDVPLKTVNVGGIKYRHGRGNERGRWPSQYLRSPYPSGDIGTATCLDLNDSHPVQEDGVFGKHI